LPLADDLAEALAAISPQDAGPNTPVLASSPTLLTVKRDLQRAGIAYDTEAGQADGKALRKTFGTHLAMAMVDFRVAVKLMRHSDPRLTSNIYTAPMLIDMKGQWKASENCPGREP